MEERQSRVATLANLKAQMRGETAARQKAEESATTEKLRADTAERAQRDLSADRDAWRRRAQSAEAALAAAGIAEGGLP